MFETIRTVIVILVCLVFPGCLVAFVLCFVAAMLVMVKLVRAGIAWGDNRQRDRRRRQNTTAGENRRRYISGEYRHLIQH